jgi:anthranilate phosphoribosyltransferase
LIIKLEDGNISEVQTIDPTDFGFKKSPIKKIKGGNAKHNAAKIIELFDGVDSAYQDIVVLNSAFALLVACKVENVHSGIQMAKDAIKSGKAKAHLNKIATKKKGFFQSIFQIN